MNARNAIRADDARIESAAAAAIHYGRSLLNIPYGRWTDGGIPINAPMFAEDAPVRHTFLLPPPCLQISTIHTHCIVFVFVFV